MPAETNICKPIASLVDDLINQDCTIIDQKLSDYHFHEVYIKVHPSEKSLESLKVNIEKIEKTDEYKYTCSCHWSTVEIVSA